MPQLTQDQAIELLWDRVTEFRGEEAHEKALVTYEELLRLLDDAAPGPDRDEHLAFALYGKAMALHRLGRDADEILVLGEVIARFGDAGHPALQVQVSHALDAKALALGKLGRNDEAIVVCDELVGRFGACAELALRWDVVRAFREKALNLARLGRYADGLEVLDELIATFGDEENETISSVVSGARSNRAQIAALSS